MNLDEELAKLHDANNADPVPEEEPIVAAPTTLANGEPAVPAKPAFSLDDLLPDAEDIAPTFRGKPLRALLDDRRTAIAQRDDIGRVKNDYESENRVLKGLLQTLLEQQQAKPQSAPAAPVTAEDRARSEQLDAILSSDPAYALGRTADIATEAARAGVKGEIAPLAATVARLESEASARRVFDAHSQAGAMLKRDTAQWKSEVETNAMSAAVLALQLPLDQADSYVKASQWLDDLASVRSPKIAASPAPAPAVAQPSPTAPAPPAGGGAPSAPSDATTPTLNARDADTLNRMRGLFEDATGRKMPKEVWDGTYQKVAAGAPRRRSA